MDEDLIEFTVDPAILHSLINSQAGTLSKALLEGTMNAIDAGAKKLVVTLTGDRFVLSDDGRGFRSVKEINEWFKRFGTIHQEGDATYGRFRMGRGQMMAFAITTWRTGKFEMYVDTKQAMGFRFKKGLDKVKGCTITGDLYHKLSDYELETVTTDFKNLVKYAQIPVELNGVVVSENPKKLKWDLQTDDALIQIDREEGKSLKVYNLGVLVREYSNWDYGCGGIVVTKSAVEVNFARNDILWSCPVWQRIQEFIRKANIDKVARNRKLNTGERAFLAKQYMYGNMKNTEVDALDMKLITDITGRHYSIRELIAAPRISVATEKQGRSGEKLHRMGAAFVINQETLTRFRADNLEELIEKLKRVAKVEFPETLPFEKLAEGFSESYNVLAEDVLTPEEMLVLRTVAQFHQKFYTWYSSNEKSSGMRELHAGESNVAKAWTDGQTYVVLERQMLTKVVRKGAVGFMDLLSTLTHEYVHESSDLESHDHDLCFYNKYHDLMQHGGTGKLLALSLEMDKAYQKALVKAKLVPAPPKTPTVRTRAKVQGEGTAPKPRAAQNQSVYHSVPQQASFEM